MKRFDAYLVLIATAPVRSYFRSVLSIGLIVLHQLVMFFVQPLFEGQTVRIR